MAKQYNSRPGQEPVPADDGQQGLLEGRHAVSEALKTGRELDKIYLLRASGDAQSDRGLAGIRRMAQAAHVPVVECDRRRMDEMSVTGAHQGVIAAAPARSYASLDEIFASAEARGEAPLIVLCDSLSDPHNLGAIVRTAGAAGAHGVIIPRHRSVSLTAVAAKAAAGALEHVPVVRAANLPETMKELQQRGVWIFGTAAEGETELYQADFARPCAVVIGNEGVGMSRLVRERCDYIVSIPMRGEVPSLNASAAAAVVLFEAVRRRLGK
ncbi:MAG: 23S rRNA (guanosine(2251)-2'-O)-methyltransferase RlmB [Ruminococcaceae bacterium]|nr:23S rRNA (guanosine(2251)-2'-O)-methyltransferase RlmB [Oscillospiraceae bacterium]